ncbi:MAG: immunoglobulin domain-containing protein, partial [Verrucomicrobiota bacterium]
IRVTVGSGAVTLATLSGLTFTEGDGTADGAMTFAGTIPALNAALNGLRYEPLDNFAGQTTLSVVATDAGRQAGSGATLLTVSDTHPPRVLAVAAETTAGHYKAGAAIDLTVTFNEPVTVVTTAGIPTLRLEAGAVARSAAYVRGSGAATLVFRYTVQAGDTTEDLNHAGPTALELNGGVIADVAGNAATLTLPAAAAGTVGALATNADIVVDTTAPTVVIGAPSVGKTDAGPVSFTVTYADLHAVTGTLSAADVTVNATGNAPAGRIAVSGPGLTRTVTISETTGDGNMSISLPAGTARDVAGNPAAAAGPSATFLVENILPAKVVTPPVALTAVQGGTAMLSVAVSGRPTPTLQWRKGGLPIAGATQTVLALHGVVSADAGSYDVVATNVVGPVVSPPVALTVAAAPGNLFGAGLSQYGSLGDLSAIGNWTSAPLPVWPGSGAEPLIKLAAEGSHGLILTADGKAYGLGYNYGAALGAASNQLSYPVPEAILSNVRMVAVAQGNSYFLLRDGTLWGTGSTQGGMVGEYYPGAGSVVPFPLVPDRSDIAAVWAAGVGGQGGCIYLTREGELYLLGGPSDYQPRKLASDVIDAAQGAGFALWVQSDGSLWSYGTNTFGQLGNGTTTTSLVAAPVVASGVSRVVAGQSSAFFLKQDGSLWGMGRNTFGQLGVGSTNNQSVPVQVMTGVREMALGERHAVVLKTDGTVWTMGNNYYGQLGDGSTTQRTSPVWIADHATAVAAGSYSTLYLAATAPKIQQDPVGRAAVVGENVVLSVAASGTPTLVYAWLKDGAPLAGATGATLTLPAVTTGATGSYRVSVTNVAGTATSGVADLSVTPVAVPPTIKTQPVSRTVQAGMDVTFVAEVSGTSPLSYQWRKGGLAIVGATNASLALRAVQFASAGSYDLVVTNAVGNATSAPATLALTSVLPPEITAGPVSVSANPGAPVSFAVTAKGSALAYQWRRNGVALPGETAATLAFAAVQVSEAGLYTVVVSNPGGTVTSAPANLTVDAVLGDVKLVEAPV